MTSIIAAMITEALALGSKPSRVHVLDCSVVCVLQTRALSTDIAAIPAFMLGIIAADLAICAHPQRSWAFPLFLVMFTAALVGTSANDSGQETSLLWDVSAFLFVVAEVIGLFKTVLELRPIALGVASYSIYLCHQLAVFYVDRLGCGPWIAGTSGIVLGLLFWSIAERLFLDSPLHTLLSSHLEKVLLRVFHISGAPTYITLKQIVSDVSFRIDTRIEPEKAPDCYSASTAELARTRL